MSMWIRYIKAPGEEPVKARFNERADPATAAEFLDLCATRLGLVRDSEPAHAIEERIRRESPRLREYHR